MSMETISCIEIDLSKCIREGLCFRICPWVFKWDEVRDCPTVADPSECIDCGHCIALCPEDAIMHRRMDMSNFPRINPDLEISSDQLMQLLRKRRSIRIFNAKRAVRRQTIERMLEAARYSPTGSNAQSLVHAIVMDRQVMDEIRDCCIQEIRKIVDHSGGSEGAEQEGLGHYRTILRAYDRGVDLLFFNAPGLIVTHAPKKPASPLVEDAALASFHMMLMAETLGLGTCYIGNLYLAASHNQRIRSLLNIPQDHDILMAFVFGYPGVRFRRLVDRKPPKVKWFLPTDMTARD